MVAPDPLEFGERTSSVSLRPNLYAALWFSLLALVFGGAFLLADTGDTFLTAIGVFFVLAGAGIIVYAARGSVQVDVYEKGLARRVRGRLKSAMRFDEVAGVREDQGPEGQLIQYVFRSTDGRKLLLEGAFLTKHFDTFAEVFERVGCEVG